MKSLKFVENEKEFSEHEEYQTCGTACVRTCQNMNDPIPPCVPVCRMGCFCQTGHTEKLH